MLPPERHRFILARLAEQGTVRTIELAKILEVTDETVRRDLEALELRGALIRIHGGAVKPERVREDLTLTERQLVNRESKSAIVQLAASRIRPDDTIFIDASSTALTLAEHLPDFRLTVLTNAHNVVTALADREGFDLICTGGLYEPRSRSYIGLPAESTLRKYNITRMFFSCKGVDVGRGLSESNSRQASFKERVIACSEEICLLADSTKIGLKSSFFFAPISDVTTLITNPNADPDVIARIEDQGVEVLRA